MEGEGIGALADCPLDELAVALATSMSMSSASIPVACKVPGLEKAAEIDALARLRLPG